MLIWVYKDASALDVVPFSNHMMTEILVRCTVRFATQGVQCDTCHVTECMGQLTFPTYPMHHGASVGQMDDRCVEKQRTRESFSCATSKSGPRRDAAIGCFALPIHEYFWHSEHRCRIPLMTRLRRTKSQGDERSLAADSSMALSVTAFRSQRPPSCES